FLICLYVSESWNINPIWSSANYDMILITGDDCSGPSAFHMVHQVVAQLSARVREAIWKFRSRRVEQNARRFQRRRAEENHLALKLQRSVSTGVDHAYSDCSARFGIEAYAMDHAVRP